MNKELLEKAFEKFSKVPNVDYAIINTDNWGDCNTCVNYELSKKFGVNSKGIYLKHWQTGMNKADEDISSLKNIYVAHDINKELAESFYDIFSKYFSVEPKKYSPTKAFQLIDKDI
ncbi:MAG: hypothetical protein IJH34_09730 [Romboutsia sp.]|nr:hypothetical protein [Romboutsia sp.]